MIDRLLSYIAPHLCFGCNESGSLLCDNCKYDITYDNFSTCIGCERQLAPGNTCSCTSSYSRNWCVGEREETLQRLIDAYKFEYARAAAIPLAWLLSQRTGRLPKKTVVVAIPTVPSHIRVRGYDHAALLAQTFARDQRITTKRLLTRATIDEQKGATRANRIKQARTAFMVRGKIESTTPYLLIDDVVTTGATLRYAAQALRSAGADTVWAAVVAHQPRPN